MSGEKRALEVALDAYDPPPVENQLELLGLPVNEKVAEVRVRTGKPGRPPGVPNKRTSEMAAYLLSRYSHPLERLAQIWSAGTEELAASLGCSKTEALQEQRLAITAALPYLQAKLPLAVDLTNHKVINLNIIEPKEHDPHAGEGDGMTLTLTATVVKELEDEVDGS